MANSYTPEDVERALTQYALCGGNKKLASERLEQMGHPTPPQTIRDWALEYHADRYQEIRAELAPKINRRIQAEAEDLAFDLADLERKLSRKLRTQIEDMEPKDVANALRNATTSKSLNVDKIAGPLAGRPNVIVEHRSADDLLAKLERFGVVEGTAEEVESLALEEQVAS